MKDNIDRGDDVKLQILIYVMHTRETERENEKTTTTKHL